MRKIYLGTSALAKRWVSEAGTSTVDYIFEQANSRSRINLVSSLWNIGEALVVYDKYLNREEINEDQLKDIVNEMLREIGELIRDELLIIAPIDQEIIVRTWDFILTQHIYEGDAIQLATCSLFNCDFFLAADQRLLEACDELGIEGLNVELKKDQKSIKDKL